MFVTSASVAVSCTKMLAGGSFHAGHRGRREPRRAGASGRDAVPPARGGHGLGASHTRAARSGAVAAARPRARPRPRARQSVDLRGRCRPERLVKEAGAHVPHRKRRPPAARVRRALEISLRLGKDPPTGPTRNIPARRPAPPAAGPSRRASSTSIWQQFRGWRAATEVDRESERFSRQRDRLTARTAGEVSAKNVSPAPPSDHRFQEPVPAARAYNPR